MPLAKSAPDTSTNIPSRIDVPPPNNYNVNPGFDGVPFEVYRYFNVSPTITKNEDIKQIREIYGWVSKDNPHISESLFSLRQLENKLGAPNIGETRYSKLYNWVRISSVVGGLQNDKKEQIKKIAQRRQAEVEKVRAEKDDKIAKIKLKRHLEETAIRKAREEELKQYKKLRQAYE